MVVEIKETPIKPSDKKKDKPYVIYINPDIREEYVKFFSEPGSDLIVELINSIVDLIEEIYDPIHCSLEPQEFPEPGVLKVQFKVLRPKVKVTSENDLFVTIRDFYTELSFKFFIISPTTIKFVVNKTIKGLMLKPTLAQATAGYMHSHLHNKNFTASDTFIPSPFCLGNSALNNSLYGDKFIKTESKEKDIISTLKYLGKILHYTESMVHYESISGTPYNHMKNIIDTAWQPQNGGEASIDLSPYFIRGYYLCMVSIYNNVLETGKLPFILSNSHQGTALFHLTYSLRDTSKHFPIVHLDSGFKEDMSKIIAPLVAENNIPNNVSDLYTFENSRFSGNYKFKKDTSLMNPKTIWKGKISTMFKGSALIAGYSGIKHDDEYHQTTPKLIISNEGEKISSVNESIVKYIVSSFTKAFQKLVNIILSSFQRDGLLSGQSLNYIRLGRINNSPRIASAHFPVIHHLITDSDERKEMVEIIKILSLLIKSTIHFNNFNNFLHD